MEAHGIFLAVADCSTMEVLDRMGAEVDAECHCVILKSLMKVVTA